MNNENKPRAGVTKIALTGFQVFEERTELPFSKINLLFGPNSAGKSAIEDAIAIIQMLKNSGVMSGSKTKHENYFVKSGILDSRSIAGRISAENNDFLLKLKSCWRKSGSIAKYSQSMEIEIESSLDLDFGEGLRTYGDESAIYTKCKSITESFVFHIPNDTYHEYDGSLDSIDEVQFIYHLQVDNEMLLSFVERDLEFAMNCNHPSILHLDFSSFFGAVNNIGIISADEKEKNPALRDAKIASFDNAIIKFGGIFGFSLSGQKNLNPLNKMALVSGVLSVAKNNTEYQIAFDLFSKQFQQLLHDVGQWHNTIPLLGQVSASRQIPTKDDLFIYDKAGPKIPFLIESQFTGFSSDWNQKVYSKNDFISYLHSVEVLEKVNYFLATQMFNEKGYFIGKEFEYISYKNRIHDAPNHLRLTFTQFYLANPDGTRFGFDEVGSGLGYVFPVLCVLAQNQTQLVIVQQPELHLHPALQAALGDVLIESAESKTLMIETHSEHLLLRILKRIRQTHLQASIAPELKINADDVCVLYFNPSPDGTTTVKRLRITEDGEFMDRWPRGFFGERDQELLDE